MKKAWQIHSFRSLVPSYEEKYSKIQNFPFLGTPKIALFCTLGASVHREGLYFSFHQKWRKLGTYAHQDPEKIHHGSGSRGQKSNESRIRTATLHLGIGGRKVRLIDLPIP